MGFKSFVDFFARPWRKQRPNRRKAKPDRTARLLVEMLERRDLLAAPSIVAAGVLPLDGSTVSSGSPTIRVQFSEPMTASVLTPSNYVLLGSSGNTITINTVNYDFSIGGAPANSVVSLVYNSGSPLVVDNYTLFVRGDKLIDVDEGFAMAQPGQLIVANSGSNKVSVVGLPGDGTLGSESNYNLPAVGAQAANPREVALADLDSDGVNDLVVVNAGTNQVYVYHGQLAKDGGGYNSTPTTTLNLPAGAVNLGKALLVADFSKDGKPDIVVANVNTNNVTVFLNTSASAGTMSFNSGTNFTTDTSPVGLVAVDLDNNANMDLAIAISTAPTDLDGGGVLDYRVDVLPGDGAGGFGALATFKVGDVTPTNLTAPTSIGTGLISLDTKPDLVVGGTNGFGLLINNSTPGTIAFNLQAGVFGAASVVSLAVGDFDAGARADVAVATVAGNIEVYRNVGATGPVNFLAPTTTAVGTVGRLAIGDLNRDGKNDLVLTNNNASGKVSVLRNYTVGGSISVATNANPAVITSAGNGLVTGQQVVVSGATGNTAINNGGPNPTWTITVVTGAVASSSGPGGGAPISINAVNHGLTTGESVTITGNTFASANGTFTATVVDSDNFTLNGTSDVGSGNAGAWKSNDRFILNGVNATGPVYTGGATWVLAGSITGNIADASSPGTIVITSHNHGLATNEQVTISGVTGNLVANNTWTITVVDADHFSLNTSNGVSAYTGGGNWVIASNITNSTGAGTNPIVITSPNHGLTSGAQVKITGASDPNAVGTFTITRIDANSFSLNGTTGAGAAGTGGLWLLTGAITNTTGVGTNPIVVTSNNHGLTTGQVVTIAGASDASANGIHTITVITNSTFSLNGTTGANPAGAGGTWTLNTSVPSATNTTPIVITSNNHGLVTGESVVVAGVTGNIAANGAWTITVLDQDHFILNGTTGNGEYISGGTWTTTASFVPTLGSMSANVLAGVTPISITTTIPHGLVNGNQVTFTGVGGNLAAALNGKTFTVTAVDPNHFTLNGTSSAVAASGLGGIYVTGTGALGPVSSPYNVDATPIGVAVGDTNQDGILDVVTANNTGNDVSLLLGDSSGGLSVPANLNIGPTVLTGVSIADLNLDGIPDIIVFNNNGSTNSTQISILQGLVGGTYAAPVSFAANAAGRTMRSLVSLTVANVDGDTWGTNNDPKYDLVFADNQDDTVGFLQNALSAPGVPITAGSFVAKQEVGTGRTPTQVQMGDFNNDGKLDLAVSHNNQGGGGGNRKGITIRLGNGDFTFQNSFELDGSGGGGTPMSGVVLGDFNKDGNLDVIGAEDNSPGTIRLHFGDGKGAFGNNGTFNTSVPNPGAIRAADFNGDGFLDIIVSSKSTNLTNAGVAVLLNQLGTGFGAAIQTDVIPGTGLQSVLTTDVNQDGFADAIVTTQLQNVAGTVTGATGNGTSPIVLNVNSTFGLSVNDIITVSGVNGNTAANGTWVVTALSGGKGGPKITLGIIGGGAPTGAPANYTNGGVWTKVFTGVTTTDNVFVLVGKGNGTFNTPVPYLAGNPGAPNLAPSYLAATPAPLVRVTTFSSGGTVVNSNLIVNGDFEARDLNGEQGNLLGWQTFDLNTAIGGSQGGWFPQIGTTSPLSSTTVSSPTGKYRAMLDQYNQVPISGNNNPNSATSYEGSHALYQDMVIPSNVIKATLSLTLYIDNTDAGAYTDTTLQTSLDFRTSNPHPNQQVRVDIMRASAPILSVNTNPYLTGSVSTALGSGGSPIVITTASSTSLATGNLVTLSGIAGFAAANGTFTITVIDSTHFTLNGTTAAGSGAGGAFSVPGDVLRNEFITTPTTLLTYTGTTQDLDLTAFAGQTVRLRIGTANNQGRLIVGVDNVSLTAQFADNITPNVTGLGVSNPAYVAVVATGNIASAVGTGGVNPIVVTTTAAHFLLTGNQVTISGVAGFGAANSSFIITVIDATHFSLNGTNTAGNGAGGTWTVGIPHTNDPTIVGRVSDNSGLAGVAYVEFDPLNDGFGQADDFKITTWDGQGNFRFALTNPPAGLDPIGVQVVDKAGNFTKTVFSFFMQSNSVTEWVAVGPQGINTTDPNLKVDYTSVSGRVTITVPDHSDKLGNSYFVGSVNGGIWKTTDGGNTWVSKTNAVTDSLGNPIPVPIGGLAQSVSNPQILYASTGVGDQELDSKTGVGVLKSTDGGNTWTLIGNSGTVLLGARTVKVVVDPADPNIAYVGVASGGIAQAPTAQYPIGGPGGPGVYKTTDGGLTWFNVLNPASMTYLTTPTNPATLTTLGAGAPVDSVTDLIIDPADRTRLFVGLGDIGLSPAAGTTGVWYSPQNSGAGWRLVEGGDNPAIPNNGLPNELVNGDLLGRVTLAIGNGRTGNESFVYVLIGNQQGNNTPPSVDWGNFAGLYRTSDNLLNFTKVMLKQDIHQGPYVLAAKNHIFVDINLMGRDSINAGAMAVDPNNPNIVYIGGSNRWRRAGDPPNHLLIRVDTGNMQDTSFINGVGALPNNGDDIDKADKGVIQNGGQYDPVNGGDAYVGEGVYWYDLAQNASGDNGKLNSLPPAITSLTLDAQGRLLVGTVGGIWRGIPYGFDYDFESGGSGILRQGGGGGGPPPAFSVPAMTFTQINGNLQIADMTSVAIDPFNRDVYFTTQIDTGVAGSTGSLSWVSQGLTGPTVNGVNLGIPNAGSVLTSNPAPGTPVGTPVSLFRVWQYANQLALQPETSGDNGASWSSIQSTGISINTPAGIFPAFAVNPNPIQTVDGQGNVIYQTVLAFGANVVYTTNTSATVWDQVSGVLSPGFNISALTFAPSDPTAQTLFAGTTDGRLFYTASKGGDGWPPRDTGLPIGIANSYIRGIAVDPTDATEVFVMYGGSPGTANHVWRSKDSGQTWTNVSATLPKVPAYAMVIDRTTSIGAPGGKLYLATEVGVYYSTDDGVNWSKLGQGMPNVPVVDLKFDGNHATGSIVSAVGAGGINPIVITTSADHGLVTGNSVAITGSGFAAANGSYTATVIDATHFSLDGNTATGNANGGTWTLPGLNVLAAATLGRGVYTINTSAFSFIADQTVDENTPSSVIPFTVNDPNAASFTVTATSDNQFLVQDSGINLDSTATNSIVGTTANHTIQFTPVLNANTPNNGVAHIAVTITSGTFTYQQKFLVTVNFKNQLPTISAIPTQTTPRRQVVTDPGTNPISFAVGDVETPASALIVTASSNNPTLVPNASTITTATEVGTTVTVTTSAPHGFGFGQQVNISGVSVAGYNGTFTITGVGANTFTYSATAGLGAGAGGSASVFLFLGGIGPNRTIVVTPALNQVGSAEITISVTDANFGISTTKFTVNVTSAVTLPVNDDFNRADSNVFLGPFWTQNVGNISLAGGKASAAPGLDIASLNQLSATDLALQSDVNVPVGQNLGLIARYNGGTNNLYWGTIINWGGSTGVTAEIYKNVAGTWTQLASKSVASGIGALRFEVASDSLKLFFDAGAAPGATPTTLVAFANDLSITGPGSAGYRTSTGNVTADNFAGAAISLATPTLPFTDLFNGAANSQLSINWVNQAGNFAGTGTATIANAVATNSMATVYNLNQTNGFAQAEVNVVGAGSYAGVIDRYSTSGFYNALIINTGSGFVADIYRFYTNPATGAITGVAQLTSSAPVGFGAGAVRLEAVGSSLKMFYGPTGSSPTALVNYTYDSTLPSGATGIRAFKGMTIDNFTTGNITLKNPTSLPFADDFSVPLYNDQLLGNSTQVTPPNERNWQDLTGDFTVAAGKAASGNGTSTAVVAGAITDGSAEVNVTVDPAANQHAGVVVRSSSTGLYYGYLFSTGSGFTANILKLDGAGSFLGTIGTATGAPVTGSGLLRLEAAGPSLKLFLGGTLISYGYDTQFSTGQVGMRASKGTTTALDSFTANAINLTTPTAPPPAFQDDFTTANNGNQLSLNWTDRLGDFTVSGGQAAGQAASNIATVNGLSFADASAEVDVATGTAAQNVSLVLRYQSGGAYYVAGIVKSGATYTPYMLRNTGSGFVGLTASTNVSGVPIASIGTMRFEVVGASLKLFWDGALVAYGYDANLAAAGLAGMRMSQGVGLENFRLDQVLETTPTLAVTDNFNTAANGNQLYGDTTQLTLPEQRNWDERAGNFVDNGAVLTANDATVPSVATIHGAAMGDTGVQADITLGANQHAGLIARYQGNNNYYLGVLQANSAGTASTAFLFRSIAGSFTQIGSGVAVPAASGNLRFEVVNSELALYFNTALIAYGYDSILSAAGQVGIRASKGASYDNFTADAVVQTTPGTAPQFTEPFNATSNVNQLSRNWDPRLGNFSVNGSNQAVANDASLSIATVHGISVADAVVQADVTLGNNQHAGVVARYQVNGSFYVALLLANSTGTAVTPYIFAANGNFTQINANVAPIAITAGTPQTIRFEIVGTSLKLFLNNNLAAYGFDSSIAATGFTGIRASKNAVVDNFSTDQITQLTPSLPFSDPFTGAAGTSLSRNWIERQGLLTFTGAALQATAAGTSVATVNGPIANSSTQVDVNISAVGTHNTGLVARFDPATGNTYIGTLFTVNGTTTAYIFKRTGTSTFSVLNSATIAALGQGTVRLDVVGANIKLYYTPQAGSTTLATYAIDTSYSAAGLSGVYLNNADTLTNFQLALKNPTTPTVTTAIPFSDPFDGADGTQLSLDWAERTGNFRIVGNKLVANAPSVISLATVNGLAIGGTLVDADITVGAGQHAGVVVRYQANGSFYDGIVVSNSPNAGFTAYIFRYDAGVGYIQLASVPVASGTGTLSLEAVGPNLKLFYGASIATQALIAYAYDTTYAAGTTGIRSNTGATFNNFKTTMLNIATAQPATYTETFAASAPTQQLNPANWTERAGNFSVLGGPATGTATAATSVNGAAAIAALSGISIATLNGKNAVNVDLSATVSVTAVGQTASLVARYSGNPGADTYYAASIQFVGVNNYKVEIIKVVNGTKTSIGSTNVASFAGGLSFLVVNGNLNVYLDNNPLAALTVIDNSITGGAGAAVGMRVSAGAKVSKFTAQ